MTDYQLKKLGFDLESTAFQSAWNEDPVFRRGIESGTTIADICVILSNQRMSDQKRHIDHVANCHCQIRMKSPNIRSHR